MVVQKRNKQLDRLKSMPKDFSWSELTSALSKLGFTELNRQGSRKCFVNKITKAKIQLHKRHPDSTLLEYQIKFILSNLKELGYIND